MMHVERMGKGWGNIERRCWRGEKGKVINKLEYDDLELGVIYLRVNVLSSFKEKYNMSDLLLRSFAAAMWRFGWLEQLKQSHRTP